MDATLELMDSGGGGGGGMVSGGSNSTVSSSCSHPDESELELGLGLSLGGSKSAPWGQYGRILTAKDFPSRVSKSSSSSSSSSATKANNVSCGTKRAADSSSPPRSGVSQVVGWPPIRTYRMNSLVSQTKSPAIEEFSSIIEKSKSKVIDKTRGGSKINSDAKDKSFVKASLYVKVNMDGVMIGRKVDLGAHSNYDDLASTLDEMFFMPTTTGHSRCSNLDEKSGMTDAAVRPRLLDGSSEFVLTYEDKDGDWMLVGDVPWEIFVCSVKRLRIVRKSEANGQGTTPSMCQERNGRPI